MDCIGSAQEFELILNKSSDNIVITDGEGIILNASSSFYRIYGIPADEVVGKSVVTLQKEGILYPSVTTEVLKLRREVQVMQHTSHGGQVMAQGFPIFNSDGTIDKVVSFSRDLTDLKLLQQEYECLLQRVLRSDVAAESEPQQLSGIVFRSHAVKEIVQLIRRISDTDVTVLFQGESGVGKTAFARLIHFMSDRKDKPFVEVNCSTIPESLFESEMFGYEAGSFSRAAKQGKPGLIKSADGGTLFLDEVGELPLSLQVKLLKVLQDGEFTPIGSVTPKKARFRLITATNQSLTDMVTNGTFRLDLFYRVNVVPVYIPALRERKEDIPVLIHHLTDRLNAKYSQSKQVSTEWVRQLENRPWPGNIRELENTLERWYVSSAGEMIVPGYPDSSFPEPVGGQKETGSRNRAELNQAWPEKGLNELLDDAECQILKQALATAATTYQVAELLKISQATAVRKLNKHGLSTGMTRNHSRE